MSEEVEVELGESVEEGMSNAKRDEALAPMLRKAGDQLVFVVNVFACALEVQAPGRASRSGSRRLTSPSCRPRGSRPARCIRPCRRHPARMLESCQRVRRRGVRPRGGGREGEPHLDLEGDALACETRACVSSTRSRSRRRLYSTISAA